MTAPNTPSISSGDARPLADDPRWQALLARDPEADGAFVYAVRTTGVYCRPTCPSRPARRENVSFHSNAAAAEAAGFRPCKRCRPEQAAPDRERAGKVAALCRYIEGADGVPTLDELARHVGWSPYHLQRTFKAATGITPRNYAAAHRAGRLQDALGQGTNVTDAVYAAGYGSSGRFYAESDAVLGMTPGRFRRGGEGVEIHYGVAPCSLGHVLVAQSERGVCAILLGDEPDALAQDLAQRFDAAELRPAEAGFQAVIDQVVAFVEQPQTGLDLPLDIRGTAFQRRVWEVLRQIPAGQTLSYTDVARRIGAPRSFRAVAQACAANAIACAIPCHRVVRSDGGLSGYRWGLERKRTLLQREAAAQAGDSDAD
ncbi:bifunctional DNA-binding transcriptional regulator/O6-methylguanine-DNA methyltransferase Ada [Marinobacter sp. JSM 1782161]|uniref:bifunctional DNA-binding transcriptional regulator/O6-methylguanine-DNA methyltransferase Ada n=1 Tax=Marinobacter sp. JSM 1782161 TaxID=2685906 RepID=UPI001403749E|nr:bifunctional DNA-binding transcriptional regulator/O6-methylguanine-DNA methyltransferase Ada [Marinobacter sp. JSM 1782161]